MIEIFVIQLKWPLQASLIGAFWNKILSRDLNYIVDVVIWPKVGN